MTISPVTLVPDYYASSPLSLIAPSEDGQTGKTDLPANNEASIVNAVRESIFSKDPIAMLDALKQIGGSGAGNIAALVHVAETTSTLNVDSDLVQSIGIKSNAAMYSVIRNLYANPGTPAIHIQ
jgi:hypothetical protein